MIIYWLITVIDFAIFYIFKMVMTLFKQIVLFIYTIDSACLQSNILYML